MDTFFHFLLKHGVLSVSQYWHLRLIGSVTFGPLLGVLYLFFQRWRKPPVAAPPPTLWVDADGRLLIRRVRPKAPAPQAH